MFPHLLTMNSFKYKNLTTEYNEELRKLRKIKKEIRKFIKGKNVKSYKNCKERKRVIK